MGEADATAADALVALKEAGTTYTLTRKTLVQTSSTPWKQDASTTTTTYTVYGILDDFTAEQRDGEVVRSADRRYLIAASGLAVTPRSGDTLTDGSTVLGVVDVEEIRQAATAVLYYLHVRK